MPAKSDVAPRWLVIAAFTAVYLIWGSTYLGIRIAIASIPPLLMAGGRFFVAGVVLYIAMRLKGEPAPTRAHWTTAFIVGLLLLLVGNGGVSIAENTVPSGLTALMIAATPLWIILIDWIFVTRRRPEWTVFTGLVCGFTGVAVLMGSRDSLGHKIIDPTGAGILMVASVCWAAGSIYSRGATQPTNALLAVATQMLCGGAALLLAGCLHGEIRALEFNRITSSSAIALLYLTVMGSLVGYSAYVWLLKVSTPAHVSTYAYVNPLVAVGLGWLVAREPISHGIILAGVLIIGAVVLITTKRSAQRVADTSS